MADVIIVETYIGSLPQTTVRHVSSCKPPSQRSTDNTGQPRAPNMHTPLHSVSSINSCTTINSSASNPRHSMQTDLTDIPGTTGTGTLDDLDTTDLTDLPGTTMTGTPDDLDTPILFSDITCSPSATDSRENGGCHYNNISANYSETHTNQAINENSEISLTSDQPVAEPASADKELDENSGVNDSTVSQYAKSPFRSCEPSVQRFDAFTSSSPNVGLTTASSDDPSDTRTNNHKSNSKDLKNPLLRRGCGDPSCPLRRPQHRLYRSMSLPAPAGVYGVVRPGVCSGRRTSWGTLLRHYYPEGGWGWLVLAMATATSVLTHGLQTSFGALLKPLATKFSITVPLAGEYQ